ncbi:hypothetical protein FRC01_014900 [Tulasnella sp. 417]|nr:hypothetical protein FRC01_014900 [Tulasnella sp. 417]
MSSRTPQIISIAQARFDAFLKEIFDICESSEDAVTKNLPSHLQTELALYDAVDIAMRRRRNGRTLFARLTTDIVHCIFGMALGLDRDHDPHFPLEELDKNRQQLTRMRQVSFAWNDFLASSPRYWQVINVMSPPQAIAASIERSGSAPLCFYCFADYPQDLPVHLLGELRFHTRVRTIRSDSLNANPLFELLLRDTPALQTLQLLEMSGPLGDLPSIRHLSAQWWQPPSDATWLVGLKELTLSRASEPDMELIRVLSACASLEQLTIVSANQLVMGDLPVTTPPITLAHLRSMRLEFASNASAMVLIRRLITPQCLRRSLQILDAKHLHEYLTDYRRFMSLEGSCTHYPESACIAIKRLYPGADSLDYEMDSRQLGFNNATAVEVRAFLELVQELQDLYKGPSLTVTMDSPSDHAPLLRFLHDQNIQAIVTHCPGGSSSPDILLRVLGPPPRTPGGPNSTIDWPLKSLRVINIYHNSVDLTNFTELVEKNLHKNSKPWLEEIALIGCGFQGMELAEAIERLAAIGVTLSTGQR